MTVTAFIGITGSCLGETLSATLQPLRRSQHLTAVIYYLVLYCPLFFFFLRATSVAQAVLICVCLAMKVILILIADCNTSLDTEYTYMHTNMAVKKFHFEYLIERTLFLFFFSNI